MRSVFGNAAVIVDGEVALAELPDFSLASYRTYIKLKAAVPRFKVEGRTLLFQAAELRRLGLDAGPANEEIAPATLAPLFEDQRYVLDVALRRRRFAVYAECGWGKSALQLAWGREVHRRTGGRVLIVAPIQVVRQTISEHAKFWPGERPPENLRDRKGGLSGWLADPHAAPLAVVNVDIFRKAVDLAGVVAVVLDEASILKQAAGRLRNNLVNAVRGLTWRLACSATPAPNDLDEYVSQALWIGACDSHKEFFADYFSSDGEGGWRLRSYARGRFYEWMASWSIWIRDPANYGFPARLGGIPAPVFRDIHVPATPEQVEASKRYRKQGALFLDEVGVVKRAKLAQLSRGFLYEGDEVLEIPSRKPAAVADAVCAHPGERAVVWVSFNEEGARVAAELRLRGLRVANVTGETSEDDREAAVAGVNGGTLDVLVAKPRMLGFGTNLQGASVVVFSGVGDSFEADYQALRRCFRYGQTRRVTCYYVFTDFEKALVSNVARKRAAWLAQAEAQERAYLEASGADLAGYRGEVAAKADRTDYELSDNDRAVLAAARPW
jgi:superfamily II DNA or RNA helicase